MIQNLPLYQTYLLHMLMIFMVLIILVVDLAKCRIFDYFMY